MKRFSFFVFSILFSVGAIAAVEGEITESNSQDLEEDFNFHISTLPSDILRKGASIGIQFKVADRITIGPFARTYETQWILSKYRSNSAGIRVDWYLSGEALVQDSWYLSPFVRFEERFGVSESLFSDDETSFRHLGYSYGAMIGYQWLAENISVNLGLGGSRYVQTERYWDGKESERPREDEITPDLDISVGLIF